MISLYKLKTHGARPIFFINSELFGDHSLGIDTAFATMGSPPTHNFGALVEPTPFALYANCQALCTALHCKQSAIIRLLVIIHFRMHPNIGLHIICPDVPHTSPLSDNRCVLPLEKTRGEAQCLSPAPGH